MFNLLPQSEKNHIRREYRKRLALVALWFTFASALVFSILLIPALLLSSERERAAIGREAALSKTTLAREGAEFDRALRSTGTQLQLLSSEPPTSYLYSALDTVVSKKSARVHIASVAVSYGTGGDMFIQIGGRAETRSALVQFSRAFEQSGRFQKVELPPSNLAKDTKMHFSLTLPNPL